MAEPLQWSTVQYAQLLIEGMQNSTELKKNKDYHA
jgi:hypothetical protein